MDLFKIENFVAIINKKDVYLIPEFKALLELKYNKDKGDHDGRKRIRAHKEFTYIYFMWDYRSKYSEYSEKERHREALNASRLPEDYELSKELIAAIIVYKELNDTRILKLCRSAENMIDKLRLFWDSLDLNETDDNGKYRHDTNKIMANIRALAQTTKSLEDLQEQVKQKLKETSGTRGDQEEGFL